MASKQGKLTQDEKSIIRKHADDRVTRYENRQYSMSPSQFVRETRVFWFFGILINIIATILMGFAFYTTLSVNAAAELNLVRVDGVQINESFDVRRKVLIQNTLKQIKLKNEITNEQKQGGAK